MSKRARPFQDFTDQELVEIGQAFGSAAGEGAFDNGDLARGLAAEAAERGMKLRFAHVRGEVAPELWLQRVGVTLTEPDAHEDELRKER